MSEDDQDKRRPERLSKAGANAKIQDLIGRSLKAHYDDLIHAPIPDKFIELLAKLELKERRSSSQASDDEEGR
jgi:hypothetical protein